MSAAWLASSSILGSRRRHRDFFRYGRTQLCALTWSPHWNAGSYGNSMSKYRGTLASPKLTAAAGQRYPMIAWRPSSLDAMFEKAPELMTRLNVIADRLQAVLDDRNRRAIAEMLANMNDLTTKLDRHSQDVDRLLADADLALHNLARAGATLSALLEHLHDTPANLKRLIASVNLAFARQQGLPTILMTLCAPADRAARRDHHRAGAPERSSDNGQSAHRKFLSSVRRARAESWQRPLRRAPAGLQTEMSAALIAPNIPARRPASAGDFRAAAPADPRGGKIFRLSPQVDDFPDVDFRTLN